VAASWTVEAGLSRRWRWRRVERDPAWSEQDGRRGTTARLPEPVSPPAGANGPDELVKASWAAFFWTVAGVTIEISATVLAKSFRSLPV